MIEMPMPVWFLFVFGMVLGYGLGVLTISYRNRGRTIRQIKTIMESKKVKK